MSDSKIPVSRRALVQRINRRLLKDGQVLWKTRGRTVPAACGEWTVVHWRSHLVERTHVDLVALARELDCLAGWEFVEEVGPP